MTLKSYLTILAAIRDRRSRLFGFWLNDHSLVSSSNPNLRAEARERLEHWANELRELNDARLEVERIGVTYTEEAQVA